MASEPKLFLYIVFATACATVIVNKPRGIYLSNGAAKIIGNESKIGYTRQTITIAIMNNV